MQLVKFIIVYTFVLSPLLADKIAVATKVKGLVEIMAVGTDEFSNLKAGTILSDGDKIRTGRSGFAAIIFIDDKSTLKLTIKSV